MSARVAESKKKRSPGQLFTFTVLALTFGVFLSVLLAESAIRILAPQQLVSDIVLGDDDIDYRLRPNARGRMSSPEYAANIRINSLGFRGEDVSLAKKTGVRRILFLGDSFTFGHGLDEKETLPFVVGQELERRHPGQYEVINGGVYGYNTANELELFTKYGLPLKPDTVVILVMIHDMVDNPTLYRLGGDGGLIRNQVSSVYTDSRRITRYVPGANWLREHSHLFKFIGMRVLPILKSGAGQGPAPDSNGIPPKKTFDALSPEFYQEEGGVFRVTQAILAKLAQSAKENGTRPLMLTLGGGNEFENGKMKPTHMLPHQQLSRVALSSGFADTLAISPILGTYTGKEKLFFPVDGHTTAAAVKFVGPAVAEFIARNNNR